MGIAVVLQDERCDNISETVTDPRGVIASCLPDVADSTYSCARFIDPYGDAIFNGRQATVMLGEWDRLRPSFIELDGEALWADIRKLIVRCSEEPHVYVRFIGD